MSFEREKFKRLFHYVVWKAGKKDGFGATKLYKVLWFSEARTYLLTGEPIAKRAGDAWNAITWVIAHDPTAGRAVTESGKTRLLIFDGARSIDMPTVKVTYEIGNPEIILHQAIFEDAPYHQAGRA